MVKALSHKRQGLQVVLRYDTAGGKNKWANVVFTGTVKLIRLYTAKNLEESRYLSCFNYLKSMVNCLNNGFKRG